MSMGRQLFLCITAVPLLLQISCIRRNPVRKVCVKEGVTYCRTNDITYHEDWDSCYRRGISCMEGGCYEYAIEEFDKAISERDKDQRLARPYGVHVRQEYFPHREKGICLFFQENFQEAIKELLISIASQPSARAHHYINHARQAKIAKDQSDHDPPCITVTWPSRDYLTNTRSIELSGSVSDDQFVSSLMINQEPVFIEMAQKKIPMRKRLILKPGHNAIEIEAGDLSGKKKRITWDITLDQTGPLVFLRKLHSSRIDSVVIKGVLFDPAGVKEFTIDDNIIPLKEEEGMFFLSTTIKLGEKRDIPHRFRIKDSVGNETQGDIFAADSPRRKLISLACLGDYIPQEIIARRDVPENPHIKIHDLPEITFSPEVYIDGEIETDYELSRITINDLHVLDLDSILHETMMKRIMSFLFPDPTQSISRKRHYYFSGVIPLEEGINKIVIAGQCHDKGEVIHKELIIERKIPAALENPLKVIIPPPVTSSHAMSDFTTIGSRLYYWFVNLERFQILERHLLEEILLEKRLELSEISTPKNLKLISQLTPADTLLHWRVHTYTGGIEIVAHLTDASTSMIIGPELDVFLTSDDTAQVDKKIKGLALKFKQVFPLCQGKITLIKGNKIKVDMGENLGLKRGMRLNIFRNEFEILAEARIAKLDSEYLVAELLPKKDNKLLELNDLVVTR
ncbi:MAG: hypothetical protein ACMUJM_14325 [bacterium]